MARRRLRIRTSVGSLKGYSKLSPASQEYVKMMEQQSKELTTALLDIFDQFEEASEDLMIIALTPTIERAKYYTPKDSGALVNSAYLEKTSFRRRPRVEIGFAKNNFPPYAAFVHEVLEFNHAEPTRAKFLETAVIEDLNQIYLRLTALYAEFMNGPKSGPDSYG